MNLKKLFTLLVLAAAVWTVESKPVSAKTDCWQEYAMCIDAASLTRENCYIPCNAIIACELGCDSRYYDAYAVCETDYENCLNP
jgi:hypothetical protein